jgi:hypothetical protein
MLIWSAFFNPLVELLSQTVDMSAEMTSESMEIITMSVDKHQATKNYEVRSSLKISRQPNHNVSNLIALM